LFKRSGAAVAKLSYLGHVMTENRHGLVVEACVTEASQRAEREAALKMLRQVRRSGSATLGADKAYQEEQFITALRQQNIRPHLAEYAASKNWPNWLSKEEREHPGFARSQQKRKLVEQVFGWIKSAGGMRRTKFRGRRRVEWMFRMAATAYNLVRMRSLLAKPT
jgi:DDE family transposase